MPLEREGVYFSEDLSQLPCEQSRFDLIRNLFPLDLTVLSHVKQTPLSSSGEKKNMLGKATRSLQGRVAQSRMSKSIGAMQFM